MKFNKKIIFTLMILLLIISIVKLIFTPNKMYYTIAENSSCTLSIGGIFYTCNGLKYFENCLPSYKSCRFCNARCLGFMSVNGYILPIPF